VRGFEEARAILRSSSTSQAGFNAEMIGQVPGTDTLPILYLEGKAHQEQRRRAARFFTPKAVSERYRLLMERLADKLTGSLQRSKRADLSRLTLTLAVRVAAEVVGLTNSRLPGMARRLDAFFEEQYTPAGGWRPLALIRALWMHRRVATFFYLDVKPAINARRRALKDDVISHLIAQGYSDSEILTECLTYAAAGMVTTREFISVAAWHLLEQPALRERYLAAPEEERYAMLHEILRLEPVVGTLQRRATADLRLESNGAQVIIPQGDPIHIHIHGTNADEAIVGEEPLALRPGRTLKGDNIPAMLMSFGDGAHRCPGAYLAVQETDIFLRRLLALDGLRIERAPTIRWNDLVTGYELRQFLVAVD
jgi:cytochrome P450